MNLPESIKRKLVSAEEAVSIITPGENVFVGTACATPRTLIAAAAFMIRPEWQSVGLGRALRMAFTYLFWKAIFLSAILPDL